MNSRRPVVLAATDFSPLARHAVDRAARIAHEKAAALALLHVLPGAALERVRAWLGSDTDAEARLRDAARDQLDALAQRVRAARQLGAGTALRDGPVVDATLNEAEQCDAHLIVLGARGAGFMRRLLLGPTAERLMRRTQRPLLVVRQTPHERYRRVLVAVDFSPWSAGTIDAARWVAPHAQFVLATVFDVPFEGQLRFAGVDESRIRHYREHARAEALARLQALATRAGLASGQWQACAVEGDAALRLVELEQEYDCDLVAVGKHGTALVVDAVLGSVTQRVVAECSGDVLITTHADAS